MTAVKKYSNWGNYPVVKGHLHTWNGNLPDTSPLIPRGNGRSYGDASLGTDMLSMLTHDAIHTFDAESATVKVAGGALLKDVLKAIVPHGCFLPVVPGTKYITIGGAIACDIHGKNHESDGTFCDYVTHLTLQTNTDEIVEIGPEQNAELFNMTCGGMGLTGIILDATIRLKKISSVDVHVETQTNILLTEELGQPFLDNHHTYQVGWVDVLNSDGTFWPIVYQFGEHVKNENATFPLQYKQPKPKNVPFNLPKFVLSQGAMKIYNKRYYKKAVGVKATQHIEPFFWPLDGLGKWNRIYGKNGFTQYQLVVPDSSGTEGLRTLFRFMLKAPIKPYLIVFKRFGEGRDHRPLSFPMTGYTLAIDFKMHPNLLPYLDKLDQMVMEMGGRLYLAKDARMSAAAFANMYPQAAQFKTYIHQLNGGRFRSAQSDRLGITGKTP